MKPFSLASSIIAALLVAGCFSRTDSSHTGTEESTAINNNLEAQAVRLVKQLGGDDFNAREEAQKQLMAMPSSVLDIVKTLVGKSSDLEVKIRGKKVVEALEVKKLLEGGEIQASSVVAYYTFNDGPNDRSGNGLHAIVYGARLVSDRHGNEAGAYRFDGKKDYLDISRIMKRMPRHQHTIALWFRRRGGLDRFQMLFSNWHREYLGIRDGKLLGRMCVADRREASVSHNTALITEARLTPERWHHVALTFEKGKAFAIYLDGKPIIKREETKNQGAAWYGERFELGRVFDDQSARLYFSGDLDDVLILNRALSNREIAALAKKLNNEK